MTDRGQAVPPPMAVLEAVFHTERRRLFRYFRRRTDADVASDLVQEVFARAAKKKRLEQADNPAAYLARIARNLLIDRARRAGRDRVLFFPLDERHDAPRRRSRRGASKRPNFWAAIGKPLTPCRQRRAASF